MDKKSVLIACMLVVVFILGGYDLIMALASSQEQSFEQLSYDANGTNTTYANNNSIGTTDVSQQHSTTTSPKTTTKTRTRTPTTDNTNTGNDDATGGTTDQTSDGNTENEISG
ncbi:MAG: hypothetical protein QME14_02780 [Methanobacteriaceae archaeon]|nr:hypothetical protein [Methanobacteriaceae archaeon]